MQLKVIWLLCWVMLSINVDASPAAIQTNIQANYAYLYSDDVLSLVDVQSEVESQWTKVDSLGSYGFREGEFWLRIRLKNTSPAQVSPIIRFSYPSHDEVDFYEVSAEQQLIEAWRMGDMRSRSYGALMDKHPAVQITLMANEVKWVYARVKSLNAMVLSLDIMSEQEHQSSVHIQGVFSGLIYGVLLVMALYNFCLAVSMRDKAYYVYVAYVMTFLGFVLTLTGDGYYYLWPDSPEINRVLLPLLSGFLIIPSLFFPYYLLDIKKYAPHVIWFYRLAGYLATLFLICIPLMGIALSIVVLNTLSVILSIGMLLMGLYLSYKKVPLAGLYTFAWFMLLSGLAVLSLASLGLVESNLVTRNAGLLGGVIEVVILSLALAQRISKERNDKMRAINDAMRNRKLFQELFDQAPIGIGRFDLQGNLVAANPILIRMLGFSSEHAALKDAHVLSNVITDHEQIKQQLLNHKKVLDKELELKDVAGNIIPCSVSLHLYEESGQRYIEAYVTDIRERVDAQSMREYMEQERLTSIEQLVTGVAHEINTPLGVNITSVSHIKEILDEVDGEMQRRSLTRDTFNQFISDSQQLLQIVTHNLQKMSNLVRRFKLVSVAHTDKVVMNLKQHLELSLHSHLFIGQNIQVDLNCPDDLNIESYPAAWNIIMEQLLENSIVHGFSDKQIHKKITITVTLLSDEQIRFEYQDNGQGLDSDLVKRAFDPFVTTKRGSSEHAGLGLYRIYNLVHRALEGEANLQGDSGFYLSLTVKAPLQPIQHSA